MDYRELVLSLLKEKKYPKLEGYIVMDIYYKMIPIDYQSLSIFHYDRRFDNPEDVYSRDSNPFAINFMVCIGDYNFYLHQIDTLDTESFPMKCITIKIDQSYIDNVILFQKSESFEEEIYKFLTLLNYDVPRIASSLNMGFFASTRFLPQRINLWVYKYAKADIHQIPLSRDQQLCFGPSTKLEVLPIRTVVGRLSECKSKSTLLSLNNNLEFPHLKYTDHFSTKWKSLIPLAFNPLENPIIV